MMCGVTNNVDSDEAVSVIVAATKTISDSETSGTAYATVKVDADGDLYESISGSGSGFTSYETWLDSGLNSEVWVECTVNSGSLDTSAGTGSRLACTSDRIWGIECATDCLQTANITLDFYDAASGGSLLDSQTVTLEVEVTPD